MTEPLAERTPTAVERRIVSVLFADLVGFTTLSEELDPEDMASIQDAYFASVRQTIERYGGSLEKFIGDAAMAVFGVPRSRDDDAERAVRAGLALIRGVEQLAGQLGLEAGQLQLRVGVNTGEVVHAIDGPDAGRVTGDTVNTAARLQSASQPDRVLLGELTALAVREVIELTDMGSIALKGKAEATRAWQADGIRARPSRDAAMGELRAPMLGREVELALLDAASGGLVAIVAPPGVGKSRLVTEFERRRIAAGAVVLRARVRPQQASPYEAVAQLFEAAGAPGDLDAALERTQPHAGRRAVVAAEVGRLLEPGTGIAGPAAGLAAEQETRFRAWGEALDALIAPRNAIWLVEDVHWAGADLLAFLRQSAGSERLIVCTARPSLREVAAGWLEGAELLELATLPRADASHLIRALVGEALPETLVSAVAERSDGNPLFIEELLRTWVSVGTLTRDGQRWHLALEPHAVSLPPTVQAIYAAQLDDLPGDARLVARRASVAGRRFADAALGPLGLEDRRGGLDVLRHRDFVAGPQADPLGGDVYAFRHALLRDAGYASLARAERATLHVALAGWLEETAGHRGDEVAQLIAEHYAAALESLPAIRAQGRAELRAAGAGWFERAATFALQMAAPAEAIRLLDRAVELTDSDAGVDLARRRLHRGRAMAASADLEAGIADMTAALESLATGLPQTHALYAEAAYALGLALMQQIRFEEAAALTSEAMLRVDGLEEAPGRARLMALHAWSVAANGGTDGVVEEAGRAREIGAELGDPGLELDLLEHWATVNDEVAGVDESVWLDLAQRARALGRPRQVAVASRIAAMLHADQDPRASLTLLDEAEDVARSHGLTEQGGWVNLARAEALLVMGKWNAALEVADRAISVAERYAYQRLAFRTWMIALPILAARRDASWLSRYEAWWSVASGHLPATPSPYGRVLHAATALWLARARGEPDPMPVGLPVPSIVMSNPHFIAAREIVAESLASGGAIDSAAALVAKEPQPDWSPLMNASHALIRAQLAYHRSEPGHAAALAAEAVEHARTIGAPWWEARALLLMDDRPQAEAILRMLGAAPPR